MDLHSGLPYWIARNPLYNYFNPLQSDYSTDVVIIGSGITGALVAHELCTAGIKCAVIDKRSISTGSSIASTALLQYEIDTPLSELLEMMDEESAVKAYECCLQSITDIENVFKSIGFNPDFERVPSIYYASNKKGLDLIKKEYVVRKRYGLPVEFLNEDDLYQMYGIKAPGALENNDSAQIDAYKAATHLIKHHLDSGDMEVFSHTEIDEYNELPNGYILTTATGKKIQCNYVIVAAGFEAGKFLPEQVMKLTSTYAIVSQPVAPEYIWNGRSLIWETAEPYLYIRTTDKNRIIVGGEDVDFKNEVIRDGLMRRKFATLEKKFNKLFPDIPFVTEMSWTGTFSSTEDGLPFIGAWSGKERMLYALGYGGNGITFSMIAAQMLRNKLEGKKDDREEVFGFERMVKETV